MIETTFSNNHKNEIEKLSHLISECRDNIKLYSQYKFVYQVTTLILSFIGIVLIGFFPIISIFCFMFVVFLLIGIDNCAKYESACHISLIEFLSIRRFIECNGDFDLHNRLFKAEHYYLIYVKK